MKKFYKKFIILFYFQKEHQHNFDERKSIYEFPKKLKVLTHDETNLHKTKLWGTEIYVMKSKNLCFITLEKVELKVGGAQINFRNRPNF